MLTKDITSPVISSTNIEVNVSCILYSKRQPVCQRRHKKESYAQFMNEQKAEIVNWEVEHRIIATVHHFAMKCWTQSHGEEAFTDGKDLQYEDEGV